MKSQVVGVVLANLWWDVQLQWVDPATKLARLYLQIPYPPITEGSTAALYDHDTGMQNPSVAQAVSIDDWVIAFLACFSCKSA